MTDTAPARSAGNSAEEEGPPEEVGPRSSPDEQLAGIQTRGLRKVYALARGKRRRRGPTGLPGMGPSAPSPPPTPPGKEPLREIVALEGLDLDVRSGEFFGLLGPNGAGKTTTIGILTTRVRPTSGTALVGGVSVVEDPVGVRRRIGVVPQRPNPDRVLTAMENLVYHATYFGIPKGEATSRARALMERFGLAERGGAKVDQLSGGQQQRLMVARALIHDPVALFLDEPTVGLDPQARLDLWDILRTLHAEGRTIVLTTHYMEEADRLCERIAIVDRGRLLALDTPTVLKARAPGGTLVELMLDGDAAAALPAAREVSGVMRAEADGAVLRGYAERGGEVIPPLIHAAEAAGRTVRDIHLAPPSLETLFVSMTGRRLDR
jgi:ABC-2 type transport system ATP-binding protein